MSCFSVAKVWILNSGHELCCAFYYPILAFVSSAMCKVGILAAASMPRAVANNALSSVPFMRLVWKRLHLTQPLCKPLTH